MKSDRKVLVTLQVRPHTRKLANQLTGVVGTAIQHEVIEKGLIALAEKEGLTVLNPGTNFVQVVKMFNPEAIPADKNALPVEVD